MIEQRLAGLYDSFEHRQDRLQAGELLLVDEDVGVLELDRHLVGVGDEIRRDIAAVELHALDHIELGLQALGLLDRDDALVADLLHGLGDHAADLVVAVSRNGADLGDFVVGRDLLGVLLQAGDHGVDGEIDTALEIHRVGAGGNRLGTFPDDGLSQDAGGGGAVAGQIGGLGGHLAQHLRAHVLELVFELDLLGDGDAILGDARRAERLLDDDVATLGAERDFHRIGEDVDAAQHLLAGVAVEFDFLGRHVGISLRIRTFRARAQQRYRR